MLTPTRMSTRRQALLWKEHPKSPLIAYAKQLGTSSNERIVESRVL